MGNGGIHFTVLVKLVILIITNNSYRVDDITYGTSKYNVENLLTCNGDWLINYYRKVRARVILSHRQHGFQLHHFNCIIVFNGVNLVASRWKSPNFWEILTPEDTSLRTDIQRIQGIDKFLNSENLLLDY